MGIKWMYNGRNKLLVKRGARRIIEYRKLSMSQKIIGHYDSIQVQYGWP